MGRNRKYFTEEEKISARKNRQKKYYENNKENIIEKNLNRYRLRYSKNSFSANDANKNIKDYEEKQRNRIPEVLKKIYYQIRFNSCAGRKSYKWYYNYDIKVYDSAEMFRNIIDTLTKKDGYSVCKMNDDKKDEEYYLISW